MAKAVLGIIGGSGIYDLPGIANVREAATSPAVGSAVRRVAHRRDGGAASGVPAAAR